MKPNPDYVTIYREEYDRLLKTEARIQFLKEYCAREVFSSSDIKYYLGILEEEEKDNE